MSRGHHRKQHDWTLAVLIGAIFILWGAIGVAKALTSPHAVAYSAAPAASSSPPVVHAKLPQSPKPVTQAKAVTVAAGDSLWGLAQQYCHNGNDWNNLARANAINSWVISPGQKIRISC